MPVIPQSDVAITLHDATYKFAQSELDGSTTFGYHGMFLPPQFPGGAGGYPQFEAEIFNNGYNTVSPLSISAAPQNFTLQRTAATAFNVTQTGSQPAIQFVSFDGETVCYLAFDPGTGNVSVKLQAFPGVIDYSDTGLTLLTVTNQQSFSVGGVFPAVLADGSRAFVMWGISLVDFFNKLLIIPANLATPIAYVNDPGPGSFPGGNPTVSFPDYNLGENFYADFTGAPTLAVFKVVFDLTVPTVPVVTITAFASGDLSTAAGVHAGNSFWASGFNNGAAAPYYVRSNNPFGGPAIFGIDYLSGNNSGCWYVLLDCSAFGQVTFAMPDASIGPSSSSTVYWVGAYQGSGGTIIDYWHFYPMFNSADGSIWWIRAPLQDGAGNYVLEPLSGEVYTSLVAVKGKILIDPKTLPVVPLPFCIKEC